MKAMKAEARRGPPDRRPGPGVFLGHRSPSSNGGQWGGGFGGIKKKQRARSQVAAELERPRRGGALSLKGPPSLLVACPGGKVRKALVRAWSAPYAASKRQSAGRRGARTPGAQGPRCKGSTREDSEYLPPTTCYEPANRPAHFVGIRRRNKRANQLPRQSGSKNQAHIYSTR